MTVPANEEVKKAKTNYRLKYFGILLIAALNLVINLGRLNIQDWDEARHGINAYEMYRSGDGLVTTYLHKPDFWNTKPPLGAWFISGSFHLFGVSVFSFRLPSALCALLSVAFIMLLSRRHYGESVSLLAGLILASAIGFIAYHSGKTGDYDAPLALFILLSLFFLDKTEDHPAWIYVSAVFVSATLLLKSFAAIQLFAMIFLYLIVNRNWKRFRFYHYLGFIVIALAPVALWAYARYLRDGLVFFQKMIELDFVKRTQTSMVRHPSYPGFYVLMAIGYFLPWSLFALRSLFYRNRIERRKKFPWLNITLNQFFQQPVYAIWILTPIILFGIAKTKFEWYINPIYPALAVFTAWHFHTLWNDYSSEEEKQKRHKRLGIVFGICLFLAEAAIVGYSFRTDPSQTLIASLPPEHLPPQSTFFFSQAHRWNYARIFVAEAVRGAQVKEIDCDKDFLSLGKTGDLLLLPAEQTYIQFSQTNHLEIAHSNQSWIIVKK